MGYQTAADWERDRATCPTDHAHIVEGRQLPPDQIPEWICAMMLALGAFGPVFDCRCRDCGASMPMLRLPRSLMEQLSEETGEGLYHRDEKPDGSTFSRKG